MKFGTEMLVDGKSIDCVNLGAVAASAAAGAFSPGLLTLGKSAIGMGVGALSEFATRDLAMWQGLVTVPTVLFKKGTASMRWTVSSNCPAPKPKPC